MSEGADAVPSVRVLAEEHKEKMMFRKAVKHFLKQSQKYLESLHANGEAISTLELALSELNYGKGLNVRSSPLPFFYLFRRDRGTSHARNEHC